MASRSNTAQHRLDGWRRSRLIVALALIAVLVVTGFTASPGPANAASGCRAAANPVACENAKPGTNPRTWDVSGAGDPTIQGFATDISVQNGATIGFKIDTDAANYSIDIYRTGWYQGLGARKVGSVAPSAALPQNQPECLSDLATELYDCGTWGISASWLVPDDAVSGVYVALVRRADTGGESHIIFIVRDQTSRSDVLFQTSDPTWQAYNSYGGSDFYQGAANGRAYKISYNRPIVTREGTTKRDFYFSSEYAQVRFMERNGYDVSYFSGVDTDRFGSLLTNHRVILSVGHDEYWSGDQRANLEAARDAGVNIQFLTGNTGYWRTRYEPSAAGGTATDYRTLVSYKETWSDAKIDPSPQWTGTWRDPRFASQQAGAGLPENALTGTLFKANHDDLPVTVSAQEGKLRTWKNTTLTALPAGTAKALAPHTVGYESDEDTDNGFRPPGLIHLSTTVGPTPEYLVDYGNTVVPGSTSHNTTLYKAPSGALVLSSGSVQWAWGLDATHDGQGAPADPDMQQAQVNLLADMGAQPATLMSGLEPAQKSTDSTPPVARVTSPAVNSTIAAGTRVTVTGTASDVGGVVAGVEVSTDGGATWRLATGTTSWSFSYHQTGLGAADIRARAIDDSANYPSTPAVVNLVVTGPTSVLGQEIPTVPDSGDGSAIEAGMRFSPDSNGFVSGVSFYKSAANTGTHTGSLWDSAGTRLATVTFAAETATGWQTAYFDSAVAVTAGQNYVVSYTAPQGHYSVASYYWPYSARKSSPISVPGGLNASTPGIFGNPGTFPTETYRGSNYFVDVSFNTVDSTPLRATDQWPSPDTTEVPPSTPISARFSGDVDPASVAFTVTTATGAPVTGTTSYTANSRTALFTADAPLTPGTAFVVKLTATGATGAALEAGSSWSFTTAAADAACPCSLFAATTTPVIPQVNDDPVTIGVQFTPRTDGAIAGVKFYKGPGNAGSHVGTLWDSAGKALASATFLAESASGWQTVYFTEPVPVQAGSNYTASYQSTTGRYSATAGALATGFTSGPLGVGSSAARYTYGTGFPTSISSTNYFVDVVFVTDGEIPAQPVSVSLVSPITDQTAVPPSSQVTAVLSADPPPGTVPEIALSTPLGEVAGTSAYAPSTRTITFTPTAALDWSTTYTATVTVDEVIPVGGTWSFTTAANVPTDGTFTLLGSETPDVAATADTAAVELGMGFSVSQPGVVTGIRFYKGEGNTGAHVGNLWSAAGEKLASVRFTGETASGWQTATLTTPYALTPGERYVVSYLAPAGRYASTPDYFTILRSEGPLTADTAANGRFRYGSGGGFPTESYRGCAVPNSGHRASRVHPGDRDVHQSDGGCSQSQPSRRGVGGALGRKPSPDPHSLPRGADWRYHRHVDLRRGLAHGHLHPRRGARLGHAIHGQHRRGGSRTGWRNVVVHHRGRTGARRRVHPAGHEHSDYRLGERRNVGHRGGHGIYGLPTRIRDRDPLLQGRRKHRDTHRLALVGRRHTLGGRDFHRGVRQRVASSYPSGRRRAHARRPLRGLVPRSCRPVLRQPELLRHAENERSDRRRHRYERKIHLRGRRGDARLELRGEQLPGRCRLQDRRCAADRAIRTDTDADRDTDADADADRVADRDADTDRVADRDTDTDTDRVAAAAADRVAAAADRDADTDTDGWRRAARTLDSFGASGRRHRCQPHHYADRDGAGRRRGFNRCHGSCRRGGRNVVRRFGHGRRQLHTARTPDLGYGVSGAGLCGRGGWHRVAIQHGRGANRRRLRVVRSDAGAPRRRHR
jgi:hypothetical protein